MNPTPPPERPEPPESPIPIAYAIYGINSSGIHYIHEVKNPRDSEWASDDDGLGERWAGNVPLYSERAERRDRRRVATRTPAPEAVAGERKPSSRHKFNCSQCGQIKPCSCEEETIEDADPTSPVEADKDADPSGYWWCPNCKEEVGAYHVTYQELHESCGHQVTWVEPAIEADKDAEIAAIEKAAELCGWERVPAAGPNVWHLKGTGFTITNDLPYSLRDQLTTARATIAERDKRIETLEAREVNIYDGFKVYSALSESAKKRTSAENVSDTLDALAALAHAAEGKEQAMTQQYYIGEKEHSDFHKARRGEQA